MIRYLIIAVLLGCTLKEGLGSQSSWTGTPNHQFHIQTDEGPERYFKYQTQSGQYRKEKRLQDGTVVGSYGWIDANGYLRLRDYIADNEGYRILKSKTVFVGQNRPIQEAIKTSKNAPAEAGVLVNPGVPSKPVVKVEVPVVKVEVPVVAITSKPAYGGYLPPSSTPNVYVSSNSIETSTEKPQFDFRPTIAPIDGSSLTENAIHSTTEIPTSTDLPSSTLAPIYVTSTPAPVYVTSTPAPIVAITSNALRDYRRRYSTPKPDLREFYDNRHSDYSTNSLNLDPYSIDNTPIDREDQFGLKKYTSIPYQRTRPAYNVENYLGNGYDPQYPYYDGVSVTRNGFRYYLPRQYHEEENSGGSERTGSFGYVDPFGIRRVIYYNTSPGSGFNHRKNNRYVGLNGTPYDPRPL